MGHEAPASLGLAADLAMAARLKCPVIVSKLDSLSRDVALITQFDGSGCPRSSWQSWGQTLAAEPEKVRGIFNARSETASSKPSFRDACRKTPWHLKLGLESWGIS